MKRAVLHTRVYQHTRHVLAHQLNAGRNKSNDLVQSLRAVNIHYISMLQSDLHNQRVMLIIGWNFEYFHDPVYIMFDNFMLHEIRHK
jgi:hypothetical protein